MWFVPLLVAVALALAACSSQPSTETSGTQVPHRSPTSSVPPSTSTTTPAASQTTLVGGATPVSVPPGPSVAPPATIASDCSTDVSTPLRKWFKSLGADQTVVIRSGSCYLVNEGIKLKQPQGLTVYGGDFRTAVVPRDLRGQPGSNKGHAVFTVLGGSGVTFEAMDISGANPGGYHWRLAFAAGIDFEGTSHAVVRGVTISHTFGDGITLAPLRGGADHDSGTIIAPSSDVTIDGVTVDTAGRQGLTFASVLGAQVDDVILKNIGLDTFDVEADQTNEGAYNVVIDGCLASGGAIFFANGGAGAAVGTGNITVEHCTMTEPQDGSAILVVRNGAGKRGKVRGPFTFEADVLRCGASDYVGCVQLSGGNVTITASQVLFPDTTVHEAVYGLAKGATATFVADVVQGYGRKGRADPTSSAHIVGGTWTRAGHDANVTRTTP